MNIKQSYHKWRQCILGENKQSFSKEYILQRLSILKNKRHTEHKKIIISYGKENTHTIISYFKQKLSELYFYLD